MRNKVEVLFDYGMCITHIADLFNRRSLTLTPHIHLIEMCWFEDNVPIG